MRRNLKPDDLGDFLEKGKCAILATRLRNGKTLLSPVWHEWRDGGFTVFVAKGDVKLRHIENDPHVSIVVAEDDSPYRGLEVRGEARAVQSDTRTGLHRMAVRYLGATQATAFLEGYGDTPTVCLRIEPGKLRAWDFADEFGSAG
ncbi:MAG: pyridoxamine 5'-phosphate oxidase family protein [Candidatus Binatia bacterium]